MTRSSRACLLIVPAAMLLHACCPPRRGAPSTPAPPRPARALPEPGDRLGVRLARLADAALGLGGSLVRTPERTLLTEGEHRPVPVALAGGRCHILVGLGAPSITDLDLALHELGGMQLAEDSERDAFPSVRFCPPRDTDVFVVLTSYQGAGEALLADLEVPRGPPRLDIAAALGEERPPQGQPPGAPGPRVAPPAPENDEPIPTTASAEQSLAASVRDLLEIGYVPFGEVGGGSLAEGATASHDVVLSGGACYALIAAGGPGVVDLDTRVLGPTGGELARDAASDPRPRLRVCPRAGGQFRLEVRMFAGTGRYAYRALLLSSLEDVSASLPSAIRQRFAELSGRLRRRGFSPVEPPSRGALNFASRQSHVLELQPDRCYAVAAAGGTEGDLDLHLWGPDGSSLGSDTGEDSTPVVMLCAEEHLRIDAEVRLYRARSEYVIGVFASPGEDR
ncbi:MAG: hypothetical protein HYY06_21365 [Deltaproteobacteria bacterium]|nr:hypothetical protein [Deltaproteobacteria bacterium]